MFIVVILLILSVVMLSIKSRCPDCGGKMDEINLYDDHVVYKCRDCGEE